MKGKQLRNKILEIIEKDWPISVTQIAKSLGFKYGNDEKKRKAIMARIVYHVRELEKIGKVHLKKIGKTLVIWPMEIEKLRFLHEMLK